MTASPPTSRKTRLKSLAVNLALLAVVTALTLGLVDILLIATGLFPPKYDYGDARVGWVAAYPTGAMREEACLDLTSQRPLHFTRNEDALRTSHPASELRGPSERLEVAVSGDSHTELCAPNDSTHFGFTERLLADSGVAAATYAFGAGKYSPLQAYLAIQPTLEAYASDVFVLNLYSGNDFYDMLRVDDRPHFVAEGAGYRIADPIWYQQDPPNVRRRSRVMYAFRRLSDVTGIRRVWLRVTYLRDVASGQGEGLGSVIGYMNDLRRATAEDAGYPQAFAAQMLNQQLFFQRFPGSREESLKRVRALLELVRARHPDILLVLSPVPSYQLVQSAPTDSGFLRVIARLPITFEGGVAEEDSLYHALDGMARETGWVFVDNLAPMRAHAEPGKLFNHFDYHLEPVASRIIGMNQANAIRAARGTPGPR